MKLRSIETTKTEINKTIDLINHKIYINELVYIISVVVTDIVTVAVLDVELIVALVTVDRLSVFVIVTIVVTDNSVFIVI